jgi:hypothetical protein
MGSMFVESDSPNGGGWVASHFADGKEYRPGSCDR